MKEPRQLIDLRDYFAAAALMGIRASESSDEVDVFRSAAQVATEAYEDADAMLAERKKAQQ